MDDERQMAPDNDIAQPVVNREKRRFYSAIAGCSVLVGAIFLLSFGTGFSFVAGGRGFLGAIFLSIFGAFIYALIALNVRRAFVSMRVWAFGEPNDIPSQILRILALVWPLTLAPYLAYHSLVGIIRRLDR